MNTYEAFRKERAESKGWKVLRTGWPDFLLVRGKRAIALEVKAKGDKLRLNQKEMLLALQGAIRIDVVVCYEDAISGTGAADEKHHWEMKELKAGWRCHPVPDYAGEGLS